MSRFNPAGEKLHDYECACEVCTRRKTRHFNPVSGVLDAIGVDPKNQADPAKPSNGARSDVHRDPALIARPPTPYLPPKDRAIHSIRAMRDVTPEEAREIVSALQARLGQAFGGERPEKIAAVVGHLNDAAIALLDMEEGQS